MKRTYDAIFIGSGFSARYLINKINKKNFKILLINSKKNNIDINGIIHPEGNTYINHNIRISNEEIDKLSKLKNNESVFLSLKTDTQKRPRISKKNYNIEFFFIDTEKIDIEIGVIRKYIIKFNKSLKGFETDYLFFASSFATFKILQNTKLLGKDYFNKNEKYKIKEMNNFSTIIPIKKKRIKDLNLKVSNWKEKFARFHKINDDIYYHTYLKKFTFDKFKKEWDLAFLFSLIKNKYIKLMFIFILKKPKIIFYSLLKLFKEKNYAIYVSLESNNNYPTINEIEKVKKDLINFYKFKNHELRFLNTSLDNFVCNSHYHSNIHQNKYENIFIIGSPSINKTFSANPTGFILSQVNKTYRFIK